MKQEKEKEILLSVIAEFKCRLSTCEHEKVMFPLAGQEFRNKVIEYFDCIDKEIMSDIFFPPYKKMKK